MSRLSAHIRRALRLPGVPQARHVTERAFAPYLRADLDSLHDTMLQLNHQVVVARTGIDAVERNMPAVLNSIASTNGVAQLLRREFGALEGQFRDLDRRTTDLDRRTTDLDHRTTEVSDRLTQDEHRLSENETRVQNMEWLPEGLANLRSDIQPHIDTLKWLNNRIETVRAEMLHELRYGQQPVSRSEVRVMREGVLDADRGPIRLNLGCGHLPMPGYVNVDMRELPGVDVVAPVDGIPVESAAVEEIFSAHVLEHFPEMELTRRLLPYWFDLLRPGGTFRAVVPDIASMIDQYKRGEIDFDALRVVAYGGQEYEGDFHFTAFTPESLAAHLSTAGFDDVQILATDRPNGACLEFEIAARRPE